MVEGLGFGLLRQEGSTRSADYKSAGSHQVENLHSVLQSAAGTWVEIHTVTTGKTFFVTGIIMSTDSDSARVHLGTGASASEVSILTMWAGKITNFRDVQVMLETPLKFSSGTRISAQNNTANATYYSLVGWEE